MKESQYIDAYLDLNEVRGRGNGLTPGTFLAKTLRGKAKKEWASRYEKALVRTCQERTARRAAQEWPSAMGRRAWHRTIDIQIETCKKCGLAARLYHAICGK